MLSSRLFKEPVITNHPFTRHSLQTTRHILRRGHVCFNATRVFQVQRGQDINGSVEALRGAHRWNIAFLTKSKNASGLVGPLGLA